MSDLKVTVLRNGPLKLEGDCSMFDGGGSALDSREGKALFLCRCGASENKPYCDGAHKGIDFTPDGPNEFA